MDVVFLGLRSDLDNDGGTAEDVVVSEVVSGNLACMVRGIILLRGGLGAGAGLGSSLVVCHDCFVKDLAWYRRVGMK